jgi:cytochrome oxidase assembly protein ShyY1
MDNTPENLDVDAQKAKAMKTMRVVWMILIAVCTVLTLFDLYEWSHGHENLRRVMTPLALVIIGISNLIRPRNKHLSYVLTGIAIIIALTNLALMIIY